MTNLKSNTAFGDYLETLDISNSAYRMLRSNFDKFLKLKLELWQFIPCKLVYGVWFVLEEPDYTKYANYANSMRYREELKEYQEAKYRVLFEGFIFDAESNQLHNEEVGIHIFFNGLTVEIFSDPDTFYIETIEEITPYQLTLTASAKTKIGL